jgi:carbonic anhydrase
MSAIQQNLEGASAAYSASFTQGHLALPPAKKYLVVTCMDARIDPARAFGIELGDAHVIRNVSNSPRDPRISMHHGGMGLCISPVCCPSIM